MSIKFLSLLSFAVATTASNENMGTLIIGGQEAAIGHYLYTTGLRLAGESSSICGGSLIAPEYILTAAHCCEEGELATAVVGSHYNSGDDGEHIAIEECIQHPEWSATREVLSHDMAIVKLAEPSTIEPIPLASEECSERLLAPDLVCQSQGWGLTERFVNSEELKVVNLTVWDQQECEEKMEWLFQTKKVDSTMICAGGEGEGTCYGDSGGPLVIIDDDQEVLAGAVSWGSFGCDTNGIPNVFSRVAIHADFIDEVVEGHSWM